MLHFFLESWRNLMMESWYKNMKGGIRMPRFVNAHETKKEYLELVNYEGFLVQLAEKFEKLGHVKVAAEVEQFKDNIKVRRMNMRAAL